jgi:hypothetical protein
LPGQLLVQQQGDVSRFLCKEADGIHALS